MERKEHMTVIYFYLYISNKNIFLKAIYRYIINYSFFTIQARVLTLYKTSFGFYVSAVQAFRKHSGEKEKLLEISNFSFPPCFLPVWRSFCHVHQIQNCLPQFLSVWKSLKFIIWERVNNPVKGI